MDRDELGRIAYEAKVRWRDDVGQPLPKLPWDEVVGPMREMFCYMGEAVARAIEQDAAAQIQASFIKKRVVK